MESNFFNPPGEKEIGSNDHLNVWKKSGVELECFVEDKGSQFWLQLSGFYLNERNNNSFFLTSMECFMKRTETNDSKNGKNGRAQEGQICYDNH